MKQFLLLLFMGATLAAYSQKKDLATVNTVKPKKGQKMAFEAAYKAHVAKFHKADEKISVYEILSGENAGYYHLVNAERAYADFDKARPDAAAHDMDLDKTFFPLLDDTRNGTYRFMDSLSLRPEVQAEAFVVSVNHLKQGLAAADYRRELSRGLKINRAATTGFISTISFTFHEQLWDGSDQVTVTIRNLKGGFAELEPPANPPAAAPAGTPTFRDEYTKAYGYDAWDARVKLLDGAVVKTEQYIMKLRKDLSSQ